MQKNKLIYWLSVNLFVVLSVILAACSGFPAAAAQPTAVPTQIVEAPILEATAVPVPTTVPTAAPIQPPTQTPVSLQTASQSKLGSYLTDQSGHALYVFTQDSRGVSNCNANCATVWSPLIGPAAAGNGVNASLIATAARKDGTTQVTYNGFPLYQFSQDKDPSDMYGQGLQKFWYVISPSGKVIKTAVTQPADAAQYVSAAASDTSMTLDEAHSSKYGNYLTDQNGHTLYLDTQDSSKASNCSGSCATQWPPVIGPVSAGKGVNASLIGSIQRQDGSLQVTYKGHPLYEFVKDTKAGMISGQGKDHFYLISPSGSTIKNYYSSQSYSSPNYSSPSYSSPSYSSPNYGMPNYGMPNQYNQQPAPRYMPPQYMPMMPQSPMGGYHY